MPIYVRPARPLVLLFAGVGLGTIGLLVYSAGRPPDFVAWVLAVTYVLAALAFPVHYLWFYYVAVDEERLRQVKYFGLVRKSVSVWDLRSVGSRPLRTYYFTTIPAVRFCWSNGTIELNPRLHQRPRLKAAVKRLKELGVPVVEPILRELQLE